MIPHAAMVPPWRPLLIRYNSTASGLRSAILHSTAARSSRAIWATAQHSLGEVGQGLVLH